MSDCLSRLPKFIAPQVPILSTEPSEGDGWLHEIKHDGFRTLLRIDQGDIRAFTRGGHDWSDKYGRVIEACGKLECQSALIVRHASVWGCKMHHTNILFRPASSLKHLQFTSQ